MVDDGSQDGTIEIVNRHSPFARLIQSRESQGAGAARNRGVEAARASALAFTDADCFPDPDWLVRGLKWLEEADLVQGQVQPDPQIRRTPFSIMV